MHTSKVTQKGQIVIPQELRVKYRLLTNTPVMVTEIQGHIAVIPVPADAVRDGFGSIQFKEPTADMIRRFHEGDRKRENNKLKRFDARKTGKTR